MKNVFQNTSEKSLFRVEFVDSLSSLQAILQSFVSLFTTHSSSYPFLHLISGTAGQGRHLCVRLSLSLTGPVLDFRWRSWLWCQQQLSFCFGLSSFSHRQFLHLDRRLSLVVLALGCCPSVSGLTRQTGRLYSFFLKQKRIKEISGETVVKIKKYCFLQSKIHSLLTSNCKLDVEVYACQKEPTGQEFGTPGVVRLSCSKGNH